MDISDLKQKRAKVAVVFDGETINCDVLPNKLTPDYWAQLQDLGNATETDSENRDVLFLAELMPSWDITASGEPFPPTKENLRLCPIALLGAIAREILDYVGKQAAPSSASD